MILKSFGLFALIFFSLSANAQVTKPCAQNTNVAPKQATMDEELYMPGEKDNCAFLQETVDDSKIDYGPYDLLLKGYAGEKVKQANEFFTERYRKKFGKEPAVKFPGCRDAWKRTDSSVDQLAEDLVCASKMNKITEMNSNLLVGKDAFDGDMQKTKSSIAAAFPSEQKSREKIKAYADHFYVDHSKGGKFCKGGIKVSAKTYQYSRIYSENNVSELYDAALLNISEQIRTLNNAIAANYQAKKASAELVRLNSIKDAMTLAEKDRPAMYKDPKYLNALRKNEQDKMMEVIQEYRGVTCAPFQGTQGKVESEVTQIEVPVSVKLSYSSNNTKLTSEDQKRMDGAFVDPSVSKYLACGMVPTKAIVYGYANKLRNTEFENDKNVKTYEFDSLSSYRAESAREYLEKTHPGMSFRSEGRGAEGACPYERGSDPKTGKLMGVYRPEFKDLATANRILSEHRRVDLKITMSLPAKGSSCKIAHNDPQTWHTTSECSVPEFECVD